MTANTPRAEVGDKGRFDGFPGRTNTSGGSTRWVDGEYVTDHSATSTPTSRFVRTPGGKS
ncbi:hypothetical protein ACGFIW_01415 [Micromonospora sp. NPDC048935]|uniref:hypothetical protein n=1 Tax=Micromonospora sp. NPDC048935 TaxID=3364262 RepID=UPI00371DCB97